MRPVLVSLLVVAGGFAAAIGQCAEHPRLLVVVSVDQLCQDYLIRFADNFAEDGIFNRVAREGAAYSQCHHRHAFTVTGPGHSVQLTGAYPNISGIVGNNWFDRLTGKSVYCVADAGTQVIGAPKGDGMSPRSLLVDTVGDMLKSATQDKSRVFGVAIKDRAAILMAGHQADSAFWMQDNLWVTSTYYRKELPGYLRVLNENQALRRFHGRSWTLSRPAEQYHNQGPDANSWENPPKGMTNAFPHQVSGLGEVSDAEFGDQVLFSPFGNDATLEAAREVVRYEELGKDASPDLLCINLSSNDYVGHAFGPDSLEVEDMTYQTDRQLGGFLRFLDEEVGPGNWTLAVTADHGVAPIVEYAVQHKLPARRNPLGSMNKVQDALESHVRTQLNVPTSAPPVIQKVDEGQVYLQHGHPSLAGENFVVAQQLVRDWLLDQENVAAARTRAEMAQDGSDRLGAAFYRAWHPRRGGDVLFVYAPYCVPGARGTTHGSPWHYDTHVPLLLIGCGIRPGHYSRTVSPACLASTAAELLGVDYPAGNSEPPLREALRN